MKSVTPVGPSLVGALSLSACLSFSAKGQDWPQWGGTSARIMYSTVKGLPDHFAKNKGTEIKFKNGTDEVDVSSAENLKWVRKLGSQSYGNVTVAGGRVFIGTNNENPRDPRYAGRPQHPDVL